MLENKKYINSIEEKAETKTKNCYLSKTNTLPWLSQAVIHWPNDKEAYEKILA